MKFLFRLTLVISILFASVPLLAQPSIAAADKAYGLDPLLYNGKYYSYFLPEGTVGTPFFIGPGFVKGSVRLRGITYDNLLLQYDAFNQQLILQYKSSVGAVKEIVISDAWLESFNLGGIYFEMLAVQDSIKHIYQVLGTGESRVLYAWSKTRTLDSRLGANNYIFSAPKKESFLLAGSKAMKYKNNRSFLAFFDPGQQVILKKYLRQQNVDLKKAPDLVIKELINYCNTLSPR